MLEDWIAASLRFSQQKADFYSGARKIIRHATTTLPYVAGEPGILISDSGFTKSKMTLLKKYYYNDESVSVAVDLWRKRLVQDKYGSVGVTCYNHFVKGNVDGKSKRGSVFGPCIQAMTLTLMPDRSVAVDVFYRTTEFFKKFPADLVFVQDVLLPPFEVEQCKITFHFANLTAHSMYWVTLVPHLAAPINELRLLKKADPFFHDWCCKWLARYICPEYHRGIAKFAQAMRVHKDANERIPKKMMPHLQKYVRDNHPGHRTVYGGEDESSEN
jgi:hypothetical protein